MQESLAVLGRPHPGTPGGQSPSLQPRRLGRWHLDTALARGRMSSVWQATDDSGLVGAVKVARYDRLGAFGRPDFSLEHQLTCAVQHPNVVRALGHGVEGGWAYLAMELAANGELARHPLPSSQAELARWLEQVAAGLDQLHASGWVHRDVKPANILVRGDGTLALADFGSVARVGDVSGVPMGTVVGTPLYCAPEQTAGAAALPSADVYSLGVLLHEWLCGHPPYPGQTATELLGQHLLAPIPQLPLHHAPWQPLLAAMLAKNPQQRLPDGRAVLYALARHQPHLNSTAGPTWPRGSGTPS